MVRANVHSTGVFVTNGVRQLTGLKWKFKTIDGGVNTTPATDGPIVYFGALDGRLYAVDAETGTEQWNRKLDDITVSAPAIADDTIYVGAWEKFYALSTDTGNIKWTFQPESGSNDYFYEASVVDGGTVYFGGSHYLRALNSETGREKWKVELSNVIAAVPTVYDETIYVGTFSRNINGEGYLYALDSQTGQENWKLKAKGGGIRGAVAVTDGTVYVGTADEGLLALDAKSGQEKWRYNPGPGVTTAPAVAYGTVYITYRGTLYAVEVLTGKEKWRHEGGGLECSDPVIAGGIVYFTRFDGGFETLIGGPGNSYLFAVDAQNGQEQWRYKASRITSRAPMVANGTVYFGSDEGILYAVK